MLIKIISYILLIAFSNLIIGCYGEELVTKKESIENASIKEIELPNNESIIFDEKGGELKYFDSMVQGNGIDSTDYLLGLVNVKELRTKLYPIDLDSMDGKKIIEVTTKNNLQILFDDIGGIYNRDENIIAGKNAKKGDLIIKPENILFAFTSKADTVSLENFTLNPSITVQQLVYRSGLVRTFDQYGGMYIKKGDYIYGNTLDGKKVLINPDDILSAKIERIDNVMTILTILGVGVIITGLIWLILFTTTFGEHKF